MQNRLFILISSCFFVFVAIKKKINVPGSMLVHKEEISAWQVASRQLQGAEQGLLGCQPNPRQPQLLSTFIFPSQPFPSPLTSSALWAAVLSSSPAVIPALSRSLCSAVPGACETRRGSASLAAVAAASSSSPPYGCQLQLQSRYQM